MEITKASMTKVAMGALLMIMTVVVPLASAATDTELTNSSGISFTKDTLIPSAFTVLLTPPVNIFVAVLITFLAIVLLVKVIRRMG